MGLSLWNHKRATLAAWAAVLLMAGVVPHVLASMSTLRWAGDKPPVMVKVEFGFDGAVASGRWMPVRVWLSGGEKAESGTIMVEYRQDKTQSARIVVPASTTPGKLSAVDLAVCLPSDPDVTVTFVLSLSAVVVGSSVTAGVTEPGQVIVAWFEISVALSSGEITRAVNVIVAVCPGAMFARAGVVTLFHVI
ncbi:MAG: hypothetical protein AABZ53_12825 [Planctomycetota bacterium]